MCKKEPVTLRGQRIRYRANEMLLSRSQISSVNTSSVDLLMIGVTRVGTLMDFYERGDVAVACPTEPRQP